MKVNKYFIEFLLNPVAGLADSNEMIEEFSNFNFDNENEMKSIIRKYLLPRIKNYANDMLEIAKNSLGYFLANGGINFDDIFYGSLPPFDPPHDDAELFFLWVWEVVFNDDLTNYKKITAQVNNDWQEPQNLFYKR